MSAIGRRQLVLLLCAAASLSLFYFFTISRSIINDFSEPKLLTCEGALESLQPPFPALLIDQSFLKAYEFNVCTIPKIPLKIAVESEVVIQPDSRYEIIRYSPQNSKKNYWTFFDKNDQTRAIPVMETYRLGNFLIPYKAKLLSQFWERSPFISCLNLDMKRSELGSYIEPKKSILAFKELTNLLISFKMFPFLNGGTLLGWYRECGIIPHTWDMDLAVKIEQYNPLFLEQLQKKATAFKLVRRLGKLEDGFEFTVSPISGPKNLNIDIFFMYNNGVNESWVGGTSGAGEKFKFTYPLSVFNIPRELFWVTCTPQRMLEHEYGKKWKKDHLTRNFEWNRSAFNVKRNGQWNKSEISQVYAVY